MKNLKQHRNFHTQIHANMSNHAEYQVESVGVVSVMLSKQRLMLAAIIVHVCVVADINFRYQCEAG